MRRNQKILATTLWAAAVLAMLGVVAAGIWVKHPQPQLNVLFAAPTFSLTDQNGEIITDSNLRGHVWIAMVFFTSCPGVCPMMEARMVKLEKEIPSPDLRIVSVSIDPANDTPAIMKAYADGIGVDESRSYFLTGSKQAVFETARGLKLGATAAAGGNSITHTQKVLLIDRDNQVRGVYDTNDDDSMKKLADDVKALIAD